MSNHQQRHFTTDLSSKQIGVKKHENEHNNSLFGANYANLARNSHYFNDNHSKKRVPCPNCSSDTAFTGFYCFKCSYKPIFSKDKEFNATINKAKCDCGNELTNEAQRKANKCTFCLGEGQTTKPCRCGGECKGNNEYCYTCTIGNAYNEAKAILSDLRDFPYVLKKQISAQILLDCGTKIVKLGKKQYMVTPLKNSEGLTGYQVIASNGAKKFAYPFKRNDSLFVTYIGDRHGIKARCEGLATGISVSMAIPSLYIKVVGNADNLVKDAMMSTVEDKAELIITDNDLSFTGIEKAVKAAKISKAKIWFCPVNSDFNDLHCTLGLDSVAKSFERDQFSYSSLQLIAVKHGILYQQINDSLENYQPFKGIDILIAGMGSGKSRVVFPKIRNSVKSCLSLAHLKTLCKGLSEVLSSTYYGDTEAIHDFLTACINSIHKYINKQEAVLVDEFHAVFDWLAFGSTGKPTERMKAYNALKTVISTAIYTVFATATARIEHIEMAIIMGKELGIPVRVTEYTVKQPLKVVLANYGDFTAMRTKAIADNENVFNFSLSKDNVIAYERQLKDNGINCISVHSGDSGQNMTVIESGDYKNYQVLNASPSALAGVHLVGHFDKSYCDLSSKTEISPLSATQALRRVRTVNTAYTTLQGGKGTLDETAFISAKQTLMETREAHLATIKDSLEFLGLSEDEINSRIGDIPNRPYTAFEIFSEVLRKAHHEDCRQWNSNFLEYLNQLGYEVVDNRHGNNEADKAARIATQQATRQVKEDRYKRIADIEYNPYLDLETLREKRDKTEHEAETLIKHETQAIYGVSDSETIEDVMDNNLNGLSDNFALVRFGIGSALNLIHDFEGYKQGDKPLQAIRNRYAKYLLLRALLKVANVTIDDNEDYDFSQAVEMSKDTDFSEVLGIIKAYKSVLGLGRYTKLDHKAVFTLLFDNASSVLGFCNVKSRPNGTNTVYKVTGLRNELIAVGGHEKRKLWAQRLQKRQANEGLAFCVSENTIIQTDTPNARINCNEIEAQNEAIQDANLHLADTVNTSQCDHKQHFHYISGDIYCTECHKWFFHWPIDDQLAVIAENSPYKPVETAKQANEQAITVDEVKEWNTYTPKAKAQPVTAKKSAIQAMQTAF